MEFHTPRQLAVPDANAEMFVSFVPLHSTLCFCGRHPTGSFPPGSIQLPIINQIFDQMPNEKPDFGRNVLQVSNGVGPTRNEPHWAREHRERERERDAGHGNNGPAFNGISKIKTRCMRGTCFRLRFSPAYFRYFPSPRATGISWVCGFPPGGSSSPLGRLYMCPSGHPFRCALFVGL